MSVSYWTKKFYIKQYQVSLLRMDNILDVSEIAVWEVRNVCFHVAMTTSPSYDGKEDRGHVGGLFKCCSDHAFYFRGGKRKRLLQEERTRIENKIYEIKGFLWVIFKIDFVIEGFVLIQLDLTSNKGTEDEISNTWRYNERSSTKWCNGLFSIVERNFKVDCREERKGL